MTAAIRTGGRCAAQPPATGRTASRLGAADSGRLQPAAGPPPTASPSASASAPVNCLATSSAQLAILPAGVAAGTKVRGQPRDRARTGGIKMPALPLRNFRRRAGIIDQSHGVTAH
ncbi:hypothetical protein GCM10023170_059770 [Phytohabitans houttuyneae]